MHVYIDVHGNLYDWIYEIVLKPYLFQYEFFIEDWFASLTISFTIDKSMDFADTVEIF